MVSHAHASYMIESVVTYMVSTLHDHFVYIGVFAHVVTHYKESSLDAVLVQHIQHPRCDLGYGTVIKGKIYRMLFRIFPEDAFGVYLAQYGCGLF